MFNDFHRLTQQGAGLIDAYAAIHATTIISKGELILNDTANFVGECVDLANLLIYSLN